MRRNLVAHLLKARATRVACVPAVPLLIVLGSLLSGCSSSDTVKPKEPTLSLLPRTSPENVLYDFRSLYDGADYFVTTEADTLHWGEMYQSLFHPDTFTFYFITGDQPAWLTNPWWGLVEEVHSFRVLLRRKAMGTIDEIALSWTVNASEPDPRPDPDNLPQPLHPTWRHVYVTGILLDVVVGEMTYRVPNGSADFYLAPDPGNPSLWVITEWYDRQPPGGGFSPPGRSSASPSGATSTTWGAIKGLYQY